MKTAFVFDTIINKKGKNYYTLTLNYDLWKERYIPYFENIKLITRFKNDDGEVEKNSGLKLINGSGVEISPIKNYKSVPNALLRYKEIKKEMYNYIKDVDYVIVRMPSVLGMFAISCANKLKKTCMVEMVACPFDGYYNHSKFTGKFLAPIMFFLNRYFVKKVQHVLYVTEKFLQKRYPNKNHTISCSDVILKDFNDEILNNRITMINNIDINKLKIATTANVGLKYKGQEYVIRALAELNKQGKNHEYYLIGGGDNSRLKKIVEDLNVTNFVHFIGAINHDEVVNYLDTIDLYIQPSMQEGLPRALIEAMSRACPCSGTDCGGIPELLTDDVILPQKNWQAIYKFLLELKKEDLVKYSKKCYETAKKYDSLKLKKKREKFYIEFLRSGVNE